MRGGEGGRWGAMEVVGAVTFTPPLPLPPPQVVGMSEHHAPTVDALLRLIDKGNAERMTGSTGANADSSRRCVR